MESTLDDREVEQLEAGRVRDDSGARKANSSRGLGMRGMEGIITITIE